MNFSLIEKCFSLIKSFLKNRFFSNVSRWVRIELLCGAQPSNLEGETLQQTTCMKSCKIPGTFPRDLRQVRTNEIGGGMPHNGRKEKTV